MNPQNTFTTFLASGLGIDVYGDFVDLCLDTDCKEIIFAFLLKGQPEPVYGKMKYAFSNLDNGLMLEVVSMEASAEWIEILFERHFSAEKRCLKLPLQLEDLFCEVRH